MTLLPAFGMEDTYPCDNCQEEKKILSYAESNRDGIACLHIFCEECKNTIDTRWRKPSEGKVWWPCDYCSYFCNEHQKQCWRISEEKGFVLKIQSASGQSAKRFKREHSDRILPEITDETLFRPNPSTDNTIQWYHVASIPIAVIACCVTYITLNNL